MSKSRDDAAKILFEKNWTFEEIEKVLAKKSHTRIAKPVNKKPNKLRP